MSTRSVPGTVVFDLDDTLYLERDYVRSGFAAVGSHITEHLGLASFGALCWELFEAGHRGNTFDTALAEYGCEPTEELLGQLVHVYRTHQPEIEPMPEARDLLVRLEDRPLAVLTDGPTASQRAKAVALGVPSWSQVTVFTDELGQDLGKPHPAGFLAIQERIAMPPFVYIGDNPAKDFIAPDSLGWTTIRVRMHGQLHFHVESQTDAHFEVPSLSEVAGLLHGGAL